MNELKRMSRKWRPRIKWFRAVAGSLVLLAGLRQGYAQPPREIEAREVQGTVERMTTAPRGEIDGAVLRDGTRLHWPPHMQDRFASVLREGDQIRATGRTETGRAGDTHFEVQAVTNVGTSSTAENPDYASGPPPKGRGKKGHGRGNRVAPPPPPPVERREAPPQSSEDASDVRGTVQRMTKGPRGEIDGAMLDDGTWVHWPPHMQDRFAAVIKEGDRLRATGQKQTGPAGDAHFEVQNVTNLRTNATAENPDFSGTAATPAARRAVPPDVRDLEQRLRDLQEQVDRLQREVERLRSQR